MLGIRKDSNAYFRRLQAPLASCEGILDGKSFRRFVLESGKLKQEIKDATLQNSLYAVFLFVMTFAAAIFFDTSILPMIQSSMQLWESSDTTIFSLQIFLKVYYLGILFLLLFFALFLLRMQSSYAFTRVYNMLYAVKKDNLLCRYYSLYFAIYYYALSSSGCNTKQIVDSLTMQSSSRFAQLMARQMEKGLKAGNEANEVIRGLLLEKKLLKTFEIGNASGELDALLLQYIEVARLLLLRKYKSLIRGIQYGIYLIVSLMIALLYRALLSPLGIIYQL